MIMISSVAILIARDIAASPDLQDEDAMKQWPVLVAGLTLQP